MIIETISSQDVDHPTVKDIMATWDPYIETYRRLTRNYCMAHTFRKKKLREIELEDRAWDAEDNIRIRSMEAEASRKEKITLEEMKLEFNLAIKKLEVAQAMNASGASSGTATPVSRESPVPPAATVLSKQDIAQFKPTNSLSAELSFIKMQDWKEEVLNWFEIAKHTELQISMQKHLLKTIVDPDMWPESLLCI